MLLMGTSQPHSSSALAKSRYIARTPTLNFPGEAHMAGSVFPLRGTKQDFFLPSLSLL